jgi:hypothetical protein
VAVVRGWPLGDHHDLAEGHRLSTGPEPQPVAVSQSEPDREPLAEPQPVAYGKPVPQPESDDQSLAQPEPDDQPVAVPDVAGSSADQPTGPARGWRS